MPEGPEIRRAADRIAKVLVGERLSEAWFAFPHLAPFGPELVGQRVEALDTRGKAMLFRFSGGLHLYTHNLLWGRWYVVARGQTPRTNRQLRVALHTDTASALLYSASEIAVLTEAEVAEHPFLQRVGPDVLDAKLTSRRVADRLEDKRFRGRTLAAVLLDQAFLSGVGNYIRCDALFLAGMHPLRKAADYGRAQHLALGRALIEITRRSYETAGVTVEARHRKTARHYVFRRGGKPCLRCGTAVEGSVLNGRPLFVCPSCQPLLA
ncbi:MAG: endonuclease VIII [Proteobacteria bacterium]|nr:endonuclease VIII [Pseudomonadota bacterium]